MSELQISVELPVLDLSQPVELSFLSSLAHACQEWGFFYVTNHGISKTLFCEVCSLSKHIFSLPADSKLKLGPSSCLKTYTPHFIASPYFESLRVSGPDFFASAKNSADELFSQQNLEFRYCSFFFKKISDFTIFFYHTFDIIYMPFVYYAIPPLGRTVRCYRSLETR